MGQTSPPTPQRHPLEDDPLDCLRLIRSRRIGPVTWHRLLAEHGSAAAALSELPAIARAAGVQGYLPCPMALAAEELARGHRLGARLLVIGQPDYPEVLSQLPDAPPLLWAYGDVALLSRPVLALVGARNASSLGLRMARHLAQALGTAGFTIASGLARGIDTAAHEAALAQGTVAVVAGGVDIAYPEENSALHAQICRQGCVISEQPPGLQPQAGHFPLRNRIISGLSRAVVVVEAAARSGSLITARAGLDQGREVLAVPGHPLDPRASGCNMLIRDGAILVRSPADVIEAVGAEPPPRQTAPKPSAPTIAPSIATSPVRGDGARPSLGSKARFADITRLHSMILQRLSPSPIAEDQLIRDLSLPAATLSQHLLELELDGRVHRAPGGLLSRAYLP